MELLDYLMNYLRGRSVEVRSFAARLEAEAHSIRSTILETSGDPSQTDLQRVKKFLLDVELWKADCLEEQTGNAAKNGVRQIWNALREAITASSHRDALLSIMNLAGFGSSRDEHTGQRRAKRATAVLRFLDPIEWGVVDWRTIAVLSFYKKNDCNMDQAIQKAKMCDMREIASLFDLVDEQAALDIVEEYRTMRSQELPRAVDVELALYGASFLAWPRLKKKRFPSRTAY